ncbi:MAG: hypothetical protein K2P27_06450 [Lachnospiraceae bacterium]|nr:hypothetical protein [Lachnospiraceae bacterium]
MEKANSQDMDWMLQVMLRMYGRDGNEAENIVEENQMFHGPGFCMERMEGFQEIEEDAAGSVFLSGYRPKKLFSSPGRHAGISLQTFNKEEIPESEDMEDLREKLRHILMRSDRKTVFYEGGQTSGNIPVFWFDYKSFAADERVYNLMFFFRAGEKLILGTFYCIFQDFDRWKPEVLRVLRTVRKESEDEER